MTQPKTERRAQKARTREALLAAAREVIGDGVPLSVTEAARRAGVSKATAYRYFSDPSVLGAEAGLAVEVLSYDAVVEGCHTPRERMMAVSFYFFDLSIVHEPAFRHFLARTLDAWAAEGGAPKERRGARRMAMFEKALNGAGLNAIDTAALVRALTVATGAEAMVALLDIARATPSEARAAVADLTGALLDRYLGPE